MVRVGSPYGVVASVAIFSGRGVEAERELRADLNAQMAQDSKRIGPAVELLCEKCVRMLHHEAVSAS